MCVCSQDMLSTHVLKELPKSIRIYENFTCRLPLFILRLLLKLPFALLLSSSSFSFLCLSFLICFYFLKDVLGECGVARVKVVSVAFVEVKVN